MARSFVFSGQASLTRVPHAKQFAIPRECTSHADQGVASRRQIRRGLGTHERGDLPGMIFRQNNKETTGFFGIIGFKSIAGAAGGC